MIITANIWKPSRIEWISFWILMPVISVATSYLLYGGGVFQQAGLFAGAFAGVYIIGFFSWYLHVTIMHLLAAWLPDLRQTVVRLSLLAIVHMLLISLTMYTYFYGFSAIGYLGQPVQLQHFSSSIWIGLFLTMIATSLWQVEFIFNKWKNSLSEKELIEQQRLVQELEALKKQMNPHFLFNNLNVLSSLISEDPGRAEYFLNEFSKVYRYLLKNNEEALTTLRHEINFIHSYYALLKIRHNDGVQLSIEIDQNLLSCTLPAFSLQLLVENAVKHNIATKIKPLLIRIYTDQNKDLVVSNNLQKKNSQILSNKVGLANIRENYRLLLGRSVQVQQDEAKFTVALPLISPEPYKP